MSIEKQNRKRLWRVTILSSMAITAVYLSFSPKWELATAINILSVFISIFLFVLIINKLEKDRVKTKKHYIAYSAGFYGIGLAGAVVGIISGLGAGITIALHYNAHDGFNLGLLAIKISILIIGALLSAIATFVKGFGIRCGIFGAFGIGFAIELIAFVDNINNSAPLQALIATVTIIIVVVISWFIERLFNYGAKNFLKFLNGRDL
ncbi:MAG: hypothetical protein WCK37_02730 [Candidatus Falkowbacteria bacterium]